VRVRPLQPLDLDVHGVAQVGPREDGAAAHDPPQPRPGRDLPVDRHRAGRHPAVGQQRRRRQSRPQHHPAGIGVSGGDPERERVPKPAGRRWPAAGQAVGGQQGGRRSARRQEAPAVEHWACRCGHDA
jgi:hypothetical protein